jgi:hypothetical protein
VIAPAVVPIGWWRDLWKRQKEGPLSLIGFEDDSNGWCSARDNLTRVGMVTHPIDDYDSQQFSFEGRLIRVIPGSVILTLLRI